VADGDPARTEPGYTLFDAIPHGDNKAYGNPLVIVDARGEVVWYLNAKRNGDARQLANGNLLVMQGNHISELDMLGNVVRRWDAVGEQGQRKAERPVRVRTFHHEVFPMDNGHYLALSVEKRRFEHYPTSTADPDADPAPAEVAGDVIVEFTADGTLVNRWSLLDILDPCRLGFGSLGDHWNNHFRTETQDWSHANGVIHDPRDDSLIVTIRHQDATIKFSRATGELIWIMAPRANWDLARFGKFFLKAANPQDFFFPYHHHAPQILPNGNLLLYDNGSYRSSPFHDGSESPYAFSRAVEYAIDEQHMTARLVWEYGQYADNLYYSGALGDADFQPRTGNVLITHGNVVDEQGKRSAMMVEVTRAIPAEEVFTLRVFDATSEPKNGWRVYRSERIPGLYRRGARLTLSE
jgi:hypothetical protein